MIKATNVTKRYGQKLILNNVSLEIKAGSFLAITGESGSGKTTLLNILSLLDNKFTGTLEIDNIKTFTNKTLRKLWQAKFAYLFQNYALVEDETVKQNLEVALHFQKNTNKKEQMEAALALLNLKLPLNRKIYELSGGEQQRVALARTYLKDPDYVFADEPTGNLDLHNRDIVFTFLRKMSQAGKTIIMVTHDPNLVKKVDEVFHIA